MSVGADLAGVEALLAARGLGLGRPLVVAAETGSTSDDAKAALRAGAPHGATWVAERQAAGRGRQGRAWTMPAGEGLLVSTLLRLPCPPTRVPQLALAAGLAVRDVVAARLGGGGGASPAARAQVKWPNDVWVDGRKIAGTLVEATFRGERLEGLVVGIGLNVTVRAFAPELVGAATSLALAGASGAALDRGALLVDLLAALEQDLVLVAGRGLAPFAARLAAHDALRGRVVRAGEVEGVADGVDDEGRLVVRRADGGVARLVAGEVHLAPVAR